MHKAGEHAFQELTSFELEGVTKQGAIMAANYFRQRVANQQLLHVYEDAFMRITSVA